MSAATNPATRQIVGLDFLRFSAAIMVVLYHLGFGHWVVRHSGHLSSKDSSSLMPFSWFGWVGVEIFFVLSGFVIAYSAQRTTAGRFFQHRLLRLVPAALICSTMTALVIFATFQKAGRKYVVIAWLHSILFLPKGPWIDASYWTLSVEISFYAVIFALLAVRRYSLMPYVVGFIGTVSAAIWIASFAPGAWWIARLAHSAINIQGNAQVVMKSLLLFHGCFFAIGVFLWLWLCDGALGAWRAALLAFWMTGGVLQIVIGERQLDANSGFTFSPLLPIAIWLLAVAFIVVSVQQNRLFHAVLGERGAAILRRAGLMTYPLYLLHLRIGGCFLIILSGRMNWFSGWLLTIALVILLAYGVSVFVEPALQSLLKRILPKSGIGRSLTREQVPS